MLNDVERIIAAFPPWFDAKWAEGSLYLTAVSTGARSITCEGVQLQDIMRLQYDNKTDPSQPTLQVFVSIVYYNCYI